MLKALRRLVAREIGLVCKPLDRLPPHAKGIALAFHVEACQSKRIDPMYHDPCGLGRLGQGFCIGEELGERDAHIYDPGARGSTSCRTGDAAQPHRSELLP